jgi:hypothetical protein
MLCCSLAFAHTGEADAARLLSEDRESLFDVHEPNWKEEVSIEGTKYLVFEVSTGAIWASLSDPRVQLEAFEFNTKPEGRTDMKKYLFTNCGAYSWELGSNLDYLSCTFKRLQTCERDEADLHAK